MINFYEDIIYNKTPTIQQKELSKTIFDFLKHTDAILGIENMIKLHIKSIKDNGI